MSKCDGLWYCIFTTISALSYPTPPFNLSLYRLCVRSFFFSLSILCLTFNLIAHNSVTIFCIMYNVRCIWARNRAKMAPFQVQPNENIRVANLVEIKVKNLSDVLMWIGHTIKTESECEKANEQRSRHKQHKNH